MDFGRKVRVMRVMRGMTQGELAAILNVNSALMWQIENGAVRPAERLEGELRVALDWPARADEAFAILEGGEEALTGPLQAGESAG